MSEAMDSSSEQEPEEMPELNMKIITITLDADSESGAPRVDLGGIPLIMAKPILEAVAQAVDYMIPVPEISSNGQVLLKVHTHVVDDDEEDEDGFIYYEEDEDD